jgi:hypothetical protein
MGKIMFEVGDRVRLVRRGIPTREKCSWKWGKDWTKEAGLELGEVYTVRAVEKDNTIRVEDSVYWLDMWYFRKVEEENMITKPINYECCNPDIAEALKSGNAIKCKVWNDNLDDKHVVWIIAYEGECKRYHTYNSSYSNAEPETEHRYRVKTPRYIMQALEDKGYKWDGDEEAWISNKCPTRFRPEMFASCGKEVKRCLNTWEVDGWVFVEDWLEEI